MEEKQEGKTRLGYLLDARIRQLEKQQHNIIRRTLFTHVIQIFNHTEVCLQFRGKKFKLIGPC